MEAIKELHVVHTRSTQTPATRFDQKSYSGIGVLGITGATSDGKSTIGKLTHSLLKPQNKQGTQLCVDSSDIIRWGKRPGNLFQEAINKHQKMMDAGDYLPDEVMIPLFIAWLEHTLLEQPGLELLILCGFPRTKLQQEMLAQMFPQALVAHIQSTQTTALNSFLARVAGGSNRSDDLGGVNVFKFRYGKYEKETKPMVNALNGSAVHLDRSLSLLDRLTLLMDALLEMHKSPVTQRVARRARGKLRNPGHSIHVEIMEVESPKSFAA